MIVAGIGFASSATSADIVRAVQAALSQYGCTTADLHVLASIEAKRDSAALIAAAEAVMVPLVLIERTQLDAVAGETISWSKKSLAATGLPSVSEAAALGGAPGGTLLGPRVAHGAVTCALVRLAAGNPSKASGVTA